MYNYSLFILISIFINTSLVTHTTLKPVPLIRSAEVTVILFDESQRTLFKKAKYNSEKSFVEFVTKDKIQFVHVESKAGELIYVLPVKSNKLSLSKKMFKPGKYNLGFKFFADDQIELTEIIIA